MHFKNHLINLDELVLLKQYCEILNCNFIGFKLSLIESLKINKINKCLIGMSFKELAQ